MKHEALWIDRLLALREAIAPERLPESVVAAACADNPWFRRKDLLRSLRGIRYWLQADELREVLHRYPDLTGPPMQVGLIAAGNLPLVCAHDILCGLVSGHRVVVKPSRQDRAMVQWLREEWLRAVPELAAWLTLADPLPEVDVLIATGSNNTARHLARAYRDLPHLIRHNRFSVAVIGPDTSRAELEALCDDIFSYQGLGCRNVSNLVCLPGAPLTLWDEVLADYPRQTLHPLYLERFLGEKAKREMLGETGTGPGPLLRLRSQQLRYASMAVLYELHVRNAEEWRALRAAHTTQIQCIVGEEVPYGQAQRPAFDDFADGVDTIAWLQSRQNSRLNG